MFAAAWKVGRVRLANSCKLLVCESALSHQPRSVFGHAEKHAAVVEFTSEDTDYPIEAAFVSGDTRGWRAAAPGDQTIRLVFDQPQRLKCISLVFEENQIA